LTGAANGVIFEPFKRVLTWLLALAKSLKTDSLSGSAAKFALSGGISPDSAVRVFVLNRIWLERSAMKEQEIAQIEEAANPRIQVLL
jgi:hypothetical protein